MLKLLRRVRKVFSHLVGQLDDGEAVADTESETHLRGFRWVRCEKRKGIVATASCALFPVPDRQSRRQPARRNARRHRLLHRRAAGRYWLALHDGWKTPGDVAEQGFSMPATGARGVQVVGHGLASIIGVFLCRCQKMHGNHSFADGQATSVSLEFGSRP